jgi:UDP-N-acetylmuramate dehydrogenase
MSAGENWHEFVLWTSIFWRLETLIPGNLGTTPVQNIGAYGFRNQRHNGFLYYLNKDQTINHSMLIAILDTEDYI